MYTRILVAVGDSAWSNAAMAYASALAARTGAALRIVTVLMTPTASPIPDETAVSSSPELTEIKRNGDVIAARAAAQAASVGVPYEVKTMWGRVPEVVLEQAADCDLIVMGSRGVEGWKRLFAGSFINAVAAQAPQTVAVVKDSPTPPAPLGHRLLAAVGGSPWSREAVEYALRLARHQNLKLCMLHVDQTGSRRGDDLTHSDGKELLAMAEASAASNSVVCETILASGPVLDAVLDTVSNQSCDTIVMGSRGMTDRKRIALGDIANAVIAKASQPVFIVKHFVDPEDPRRRRVQL